MRFWRVWRCVTSELNRIWVKFSKMKVKKFSYALRQHLSVALFHIKNRLTHNYCEFYKWKWLIHIWFWQKFIRWKLTGMGTLVKIRSHTNGRWRREHNTKKQNKITNFQTQEILHNTCVVFVSIYCIFKYLQYFALSW